ncbi:MAG TPA: protoporphyrinogen oxidase, partial [Pyrinomonadaceae bacterium]|nr:protoporphyrinogen oxidase [Pyrinomonadaceae bacterium]
MHRIVVIGGGISGLAAAHRLIEINPSFDLLVIEASARLGGTLLTDRRDGFLLERGPDSFISEKPEAVALAKRLGLESRLIETNPDHRRSFIVRNGRLRPVPDGFQLLAPSRIWPFLTTDIFSLAGKARMSADLFLPRRTTNGTNDESLASFVRRRLGREALERMAQPMVGGIYTADPETLSLRATLPRFLDMERDHRSLILGMLRKGRSQTGTSGARYSLFLSFD